MTVMTPRPTTRPPYSMKSRLSVADEGAEIVTRWAVSEGYDVENVEKDPCYQKLDIDLLLHRHGLIEHVEIKADTYDTGNLVLETTSNATRNTPGCFMYTQADTIAYVLLKRREILLFSVAASRPWFIQNMHRFRESTTRSQAGANSSYSSVFRLVPVTILEAEVGLTRISY